MKKGIPTERITYIAGNSSLESIVKKWNESGLLDELQYDNKINIAELMESEASWILREERLKYDIMILKKKIINKYCS